MPKKKGREGNECIQELERQLKRSLKQKDERAACDSCVELGEEYRRVGSLPQALNYYRRAVELAEKLEAHENAIFAHRAIAEILVDPSIQENAKALQHGKRYLEAADKSGKVHFIQLAYHVLGWLHLQIYLNSDAKREALLEKGKRWCERSLTYLSKHAAEIDCDASAVQMGQDSRSRKARLQQVLSQICDKMKLQTLALRYHNAAMAYAARASDHDLQYRCLLSKLNFSGDQRLKTAIELAHVAANLDQQASREAKFILAQEKIRVKDFVGAKWDLISMLASKEQEKLDEEERESFYQLLITAYKTVERLRVLPAADEHLKMLINEKIADSLCEAGFSDISLEYYKQMLNYANKTEDKIKALVSIAETAKELERYNEAYDCFVEVESLESALDISDVKRADTAICIVSVATSIDSLSEDDVLEHFRKAERLAVRDRQKRTLYEYMVEYLKAKDATGNLRAEMEVKLKSLSDDDGDDDDDSQSGSDEANFVDKWDELSDTQILARCREEANRQSVEERIRSEKDKKINLYGETRMHEAARGNDVHYLKMLIKMGYNINARDEGGWTPLHEAVGALKFKNVRVLAQSGANLNLRSNEGTLSADGERTDSGGLTPLMEACDRGATAIVNSLLQFGANVAIKNRDDWTALDFFRNAVKTGMVEEEDMAEAKLLVSIMERKLKEAHVTVTAEPPPKKLKLESKPQSKAVPERGPRKALDPDIANLHEYRKTMNVVGRGAAHDRTNVLLDGLDDDDDEVLDEADENDLGRRKHLQAPLDDMLVAIDDPSTVQASTSLSRTSLLSASSSQRSSHAETSLSGNYLDYAEHADKVRRSKLEDENLYDDFYGEQPSTSDLSASAGAMHTPQRTSRRRPRNKCRVRIEDESDHLDDSEDNSLLLSHPVAHSTQNAYSSNVQRQSFNDCNSGSQAGVSIIRETRTRAKPPPRQNLQEGAHMAQTTETLLASPPTNSKNQIFIKIIIKKDGARYKTKGMPFASSCSVGDVRKRCEEELKDNFEYKAMTICHDDCELSDDTPIELVLSDGNKILECIVSGCSKPSASQIYAKRSKRVMTNVLRALAESTSGCLNLREMNIGQDDAVCAAVKSLQENLQELYLDGNTLSASFVDVISKALRHLTVLSLSCCALESRSVRQLVSDSSVCDKLNSLDMGFNNFDNVHDADQLGAMINLCTNLRILRLPSCNISQSSIDGLICQIKGTSTLEVLDLSFNSAVNSQHASELIRSCENLKYLNLSCTGITGMEDLPKEIRKLETLKLSLNDLHDPNDILQWTLTYCPNISHLDLSATEAVDCSLIELCLELKADKAPLMTIVLADCIKLEEDVGEVVCRIKDHLTHRSTARFQFSRKFHCIIETLLPYSYTFCVN